MGSLSLHRTDEDAFVHGKARWDMLRLSRVWTIFCTRKYVGTDKSWALQLRNCVSLWEECLPQPLGKAQNKIQDSRQQSLLVKHQAALWKMLLLLENRDSKRQLPQRLIHKSINEYLQPDSFIQNNRSFYTSPILVLPVSCFVLITTHK